MEETYAQPTNQFRWRHAPIESNGRVIAHSEQPVLQQLWRVQAGETYEAQDPRDPSDVLIGMHHAQFKGSIYPRLVATFAPVKDEWRDIPHFYA